MSARFPRRIDPLHMADKKAIIAGQVPLDICSRLAEFLFSNSGSVDFELAFRREGKWVLVEGYAKASLHLVCQNCLEALPWPVDMQIKLGVVVSESQADELPGGFEPLLFVADSIEFKDIIEDELLLILPSIPKHGYACLEKDFEAVLRSAQMNQVVEGQDAVRDHPFAVLAKLKKTSGEP